MMRSRRYIAATACCLRRVGRSQVWSKELSLNSQSSSRLAEWFSRNDKPRKKLSAYYIYMKRKCLSNKLLGACRVSDCPFTMSCRRGVVIDAWMAVYLSSVGLRFFCTYLYEAYLARRTFSSVPSTLALHLPNLLPHSPPPP